MTTQQIPAVMTDAEWRHYDEQRTGGQSLNVVADAIYHDREAGAAAAAAYLLARGTEPHTQALRIRREQVELLRHYASWFREQRMVHPRIAELETLARQLDALLPPEEREPMPETPVLGVTFGHRVTGKGKPPE